MEVLLLAACVLIVAAQFDRTMAHIEDFLKQNKYLLKKKYRPMYHIFAPIGWLNDPNAFIYYKQRYHIFYQYHPYDGAWGFMNWGHVVSDDLVKWSFYPTALMPMDYYDRHGCLAGSAIILDNYLTLFYTGNTVVRNKTVQSQNLAISANGIVFQKYFYNPVIRIGPFGDTEFRNPNVWRFRSSWYMLVGSTGEDGARLLLYTSEDFFNWTFISILFQSYGDMGLVWENPDFFEINGLYVLMLSVPSIQTESNVFKKLYQTGYVVGNFSYDTMMFEDTEITTSTFNKLDYGHDFYAAKTMLSNDGRRLLVAWLGMWDSYPELSDSGWASTLTIVRELKLSSEGKLLMTPVKELIGLRSEVIEYDWFDPGETFCACLKAFELIVNSTKTMNDSSISLEWTGKPQYTISYSVDNREVTVDRGGELRKVEWRPTHIHWHIFVDYNSIEVFCGDGEVVFSSRIYPESLIYITIGGGQKLHITLYKLKRSVGYHKKVRKHLKNLVDYRYYK